MVWWRPPSCPGQRRDTFFFFWGGFFSTFLLLLLLLLLLELVVVVVVVVWSFCKGREGVYSLFLGKEKGKCFLLFFLGTLFFVKNLSIEFAQNKYCKAFWSCEALDFRILEWF